jgi:hypothetical protein
MLTGIQSQLLGTETLKYPRWSSESMVELEGESEKELTGHAPIPS